MYGDFLSILEAKGRIFFKKLDFDYYDDFIYITFYHQSDNTLYMIPYTVKFSNIEKFRGNYRFLAEAIIQNLYSKYINYEYPNKDLTETHLI
jgi:hypothetical protein